MIDAIRYLMDRRGKPDVAVLRIFFASSDTSVERCNGGFHSIRFSDDSRA